LLEVQSSIVISGKLSNCYLLNYSSLIRSLDKIIYRKQDSADISTTLTINYVSSRTIIKLDIPSKYMLLPTLNIDEDASDRLVEQRLKQRAILRFYEVSINPGGLKRPTIIKGA